jgi:type II secretory pathway component PulJ
MNIKKKVPAFTLMEVTIAMLIAAIAIAITYTAYRIISGTYLNYAKKQDRIAAFTVADKLLKRDFLTADHILRTAEGLDFQSGQGVIKYQFKDTCVLREQYALQTDTFKLQVKTIRFTFENETAAEGAEVDRLDYHTRLEGQPISLLYQKTYSAQNLFK